MITSYWPTNILKDNIKDSIAVEQAFNYIVSNFTHDTMPSNHSSINLCDTEYQNDDIKTITDFIRDQIDNYIKLVWESDIKYSLKVHATDHDRISVHNHSGSQLSGVFYLTVPQGKLVLYDPRYNANRGYPTSIRDKEFKKIELEVQEGDIVIFPSFLWHESTENTTGHPRIIMPVDAWMRDN